jgi:putative transposase
MKWGHYWFLAQLYDSRYTRFMPRTLRAVEGGGIYHVLNRGNGRQRLFHTPQDYDAFLRVLAEALKRFPGVQLLAYCLMPNHWHLLLRPRGDGDLPAFMRWLMVTHVRRHHQAHGTRSGGHLYQGRYKCFPVQDDSHFLTVARYIEANALRARLVKQARSWRWCSLHARSITDPVVILSDWPVPPPRGWKRIVDQVMNESELQKLRTSVNRNRPFGDEIWVKRTAARLGLTQSLNPPGRPRKR